MPVNRFVTAVLCAGLTLPGLAFAASHQEAEVAIARAHTAVAAAESANAATEAPTEMNTAHNMMAAADGAFERRNWTDSLLNAEKAAADANLAVARSRQMRGEASTAEILKGVNSLRARLGLPMEVQP